jgi:ABC-type transporter Mla maintaining outer membrane lipid asymmetry ATPase subunit MlaF
MAEIVLEYRGVHYSAVAAHITPVVGATFMLRSGELMAVRMDSEVEHAPILDLCLGLAEPQSGAILVAGTGWRDMDAFEEAAARGRMGCVFETPGWISSLTVLENIMLRERHHTQREDTEIRDEVFALAERMGIEDTSDIELRPDKGRSRRLRVYEWVRACMGEPAAILMAFPERGMPSRYREKGLALLEYMASRGAAVFMMTDNRPMLEYAAESSDWQKADATDLFYG